jgi:UDP-N-acetylmuramoyl-L-alanyl-D-glutamate--2,6-diaminopimelate ligase
MRLVGITGTNGKTTTTALVRHLLNADSSAGSIGTLGAFDGHGEEVSSTAGSLTTPGPVDLQGTFAALATRGVRDVAMEASSHSLDQGRLDGLTFSAAAFTNVTRDHRTARAWSGTSPPSFVSSTCSGRCDRRSTRTTGRGT